MDKKLTKNFVKNSTELLKFKEKFIKMPSKILENLIKKTYKVKKQSDKIFRKYSLKFL